MSSVPAAVVLVLVVEELLVPGVLQDQVPLGVGGVLVLVGAAAAQTAVVQRQTVPLVVCGELDQTTDMLGYGDLFAACPLSSILRIKEVR